MKYQVLHEFPDPRTETAWRALLSRVELPSHYDSPEYFMEPFWVGKKAFAVLAVEGDAVCAVVTGIHRGEHVICGLPARPQIAIDAGIDRVAALDALEKGLLHEAGRARTITVYSWPHIEMSPFLTSGFRRRQLQGNIVLDLTVGAEALFQQFEKDRRRNIRFAEKNGVSVRIATTREDFLRAYDVYLAWVDAKSTEAKGEKRTFDNFESAQTLTGNRRLFLAECSGKLIAINTFRFYPGGLFESAANFSLNEFLHLKPNDLLQWKGIEWACSQGFRRHSLGGAHSFLTRFGGILVPVIRYRLDRTLLRQHDLQEMLEDTVRKTMKRMPPAVQAGVRRALGKAH